MQTLKGEKRAGSNNTSGFLRPCHICQGISRPCVYYLASLPIFLVERIDCVNVIFHVRSVEGVPAEPEEPNGTHSHNCAECVEQCSHFLFLILMVRLWMIICLVVGVYGSLCV